VKWLNYNHLHYFWAVAREGSVVRAAEELMVSQPTVSVQVRELEASLGHRLFDRAGRRLALTDAGKVAYGYARDIFAMGDEMIDALARRGRAGAAAAGEGRPLKLAVGIVDVIPKRVVRHLLAPALRLKPGVRLICREDKADRLLADLAARRVDVVIGDAPIGTNIHARGHNRLLVECGVAFLATRELAATYRRGIPKSLGGAPVLLPSDHTAVRQTLNEWFDARRVHPVVVGEFDDAALMLSMGQDGLGILPFPAVVARQAQEESGLRLVGQTDAARERFYAVTLEEKLKHPGVAAICGDVPAGSEA
jgi:LysR family transcriptional activator of nhaA